MSSPSNQLAVDNFGSAICAEALDVTIDTQKVEGLVAEASGKGAKVLVLDYNLKALNLKTEGVRPVEIKSVNPTTQTLRTVYPLIANNNFPEGVHHSKSATCIIWRKAATGGKEVLLVTQKDTKRVQFVAGGLRWGETSLEGMQREITEEVGLKVKRDSIRWIQAYEFHRAQPFGEVNTLNTYSAEVEDGSELKPDDGDNGEILSADWVPIAEAREKLGPDTAKAALDAVAAGLGLEVQAKKRGGLLWQVAAPAAAAVEA